MTKLKLISGIALAFFGLPIILATYIGQEVWIEGIAATGLRISPWESGDGVLFSIEHDDYRTDIHRPVFDTLLGQRKEGFVQVDWAPVENLPELIDEDIDYDQDGTPDFNIRWKTGEGEHARLKAFQPQVSDLRTEVQLEERFVVRVNLLNQKFDH